MNGLADICAEFALEGINDLYNYLFYFILFYLLKLIDYRRNYNSSLRKLCVSQLSEA